MLVAASALSPTGLATTAQAQQPTPAPVQRLPVGKPNILVIFGDDIGIANISAYSNGLMGYETPNIDRIGREGIKFLHYYGEQSCTAGRAAFLTGQHGIRTGLTKVGFPGAPMGMSQFDPSIGGLLKNLGYATGQFGKNHVGDRNESLPTVNGFDEFFGNLYHLNAEEEPELPDYPKDPAYRAKFGPRGVLRCKATDTRRSHRSIPLRQDRQADHRGHRRADQEAHGNDRRRNLGRGHRLHEAAAGGRQAVLLSGSTRPACICARTCAPSIAAATSMATANTSTACWSTTIPSAPCSRRWTIWASRTTPSSSTPATTGPHMNTWPDGAMTWFRCEKNTNWEGAFRVPCLVRWPGAIKPGTVTNELMSHNDWIPTLCAIAGEPDIVNKLKAGYTANGINYKVHLDGYDQSAFLRNVSGSAANNNGTKSARDKFFYSDDDGLLVAMRQGDYKYVFSEQRMQGTMGVWAEPFTTLRLQKIFNLMQDPFERADITSNTFWDWQLNHVGSMYGVMDEVFQFVATFKEFPPRSFPPSFNPANIMESTLEGIKRRQAAEEELRPRPHPRRAEQDDRPANSGNAAIRK